jgi:hypothetical protein
MTLDRGLTFTVILRTLYLFDGNFIPSNTNSQMCD